MRELLHHTADLIADYRERLATEHVGAEATFDELVAAFGKPLEDRPFPARQVLDELVAAAGPGLIASDGPRYFGFVIGGSVDAALCADLLSVGWDQDAFNAALSPASGAVEHVAGAWVADLLLLPPSVSVGFVPGGQGANFVGLAAGRHHVLRAAGWDVERDGLGGAPRIRVAANAERHATIDRSLRLLGIGTASIEPVETAANGAIDVDDLARVLGEGPRDSPTIVCLQAGNVNTGACDDLRAAATLAHERGAWVHVDGAFGLWAAASATHRQLVDGVELCDSWATDGHKWLNVPYDAGYAICAHPESHRAAMSFTAAYLTGQGDDTVRNAADWVPESSRRARGFATWAALRQLGRSGVAEIVERCCALAQRFAVQLAEGGCEIRNDVVLNQVLVKVASDAAETDRVIDAEQRDGTCWLGGTTWRGERLLRISVSNHTTTEADVDRSVEAILRVRSSR
jgi:glutamate/tyrosine decarboxylase-like PLP-dependent enzyme